MSNNYKRAAFEPFNLKASLGVRNSEIVKSGRFKQGNVQLEGFINPNDPAQMKDSLGSRMHGFQNNFLEMTEQEFIDTNYNVVSIYMQKKSPKIVVVLDKALNENLVKFYDLSNQILSDPKKGTSIIKPFRVTSIKGTHIVSREINQEETGLEIFNIPYLDNGNFWVQIFTFEEEICRVNVNDVLRIDDSTKSIFGLPDPQINAVFIDASKVFINLLHR